MSDVVVTTVDWQAGKALRDIRQRVFIDEQQVPEDLEWDAQDEGATHFLLLRAGHPVGTGRLLKDGHIGRIAILPQHRGLGLGERLMRAIMAHAIDKGMHTLLLSAQTHAVPFYQRLGFEVCSDIYLDAGIEHQDMRWSDDTQKSDHLPHIEFVSPGRFTIHNPDEEPPAKPDYSDPDMIPITEQNAQEQLIELLDGCLQSVRIFAPEQALWLFNRQAILQACERLIARNPKARIQVLLQEVSNDFLSGHTLLSLARRFPSLCQVRKQHPDLPRQSYAQAMIDQQGFLMLPVARQREGFVRQTSRDQVKRWSDTFDERWNSSQTDPAIRSFLL